MYPVTDRYGPNAGGRACKNQVTRIQGEQLRQFCDCLAYLPDHLVSLPCLTKLPIDTQLQGPSGVMPGFRKWPQGRTGCAMQKHLSAFPGTTLFFGLCLHVSPGQIDAYAYPKNAALSLLCAS